MGLGVLFRASAPRRGWLQRPVALKELWGQIAELGAEAAKRAGSPLTDWYWSHAAEERLWLCFVPFEENVELCLREGLVELSAKTSGAGPGYHEFVVEFLDLVEERVGLDWKPASEEEDGDETGYRQHRDRQTLRAEMAKQLTGIASVIIERVGAGAMLNMSLDALPSSRAFASSPMGEWSEDWIKQAASAKGEAALALAEQFFPWWESGMGPKNLASFAKALCWTAVRWVKPQNTAEEQAIRVAIQCFDRAQQGGVNDLPELEIAELKRLLTAEVEPDAAPRPAGIGFRRREFEMTLPGGWTLRVPGYYHDEVQDKGRTQVYWFGTRRIEASTLSFQQAGSPEDLLKDSGQGKGQPLENLAEGLVGVIETVWNEPDECYLTRATLAGAGSLCCLTFAHVEESDQSWATDVAMTAKFRAPRSD